MTLLVGKFGTESHRGTSLGQMLQSLLLMEMQVECYSLVQLVLGMFFQGMRFALISSSLGKSRSIRSTCPVTQSSEADGDKVFLGSSNRFSAQASSQLALVVEHGYLSPLNHG